MIYEGQDIWTCKDCDDIFNGQTDCLKHADKYAHHEFIDPEGKDYNPYRDEELNELLEETTWKRKLSEHEKEYNEQKAKEDSNDEG